MLDTVNNGVEITENLNQRNLNGLDFMVTAERASFYIGIIVVISLICYILYFDIFFIRILDDTMFILTKFEKKLTRKILKRLKYNKEKMEKTLGDMSKFYYALNVTGDSYLKAGNKTLTSDTSVNSSNGSEPVKRKSKLKSFIFITLEMPTFLRIIASMAFMLTILYSLRLVYFLLASNVYDKSYEISENLFILSRAIPTNYQILSMMTSAYILKFEHDELYEQYVNDQHEKIDKYTFVTTNYLLIASKKKDVFYNKVNEYLANNFCVNLKLENQIKTSHCQDSTDNSPLYHLKSGYINQVYVYKKFWYELDENKSLSDLYSKEFLDTEITSEYIQEGLES